MRRSRSGLRAKLGTQTHIYFFERPEESHERLIQVPRTPPRLPEIARAELVGERNYGCTQRPVFVRALGPRETGLRINPQNEPHTSIMMTPAIPREPLAPECALLGRD